MAGQSSFMTVEAARSAQDRIQVGGSHAQTHGGSKSGKKNAAPKGTTEGKKK